LIIDFKKNDVELNTPDWDLVKKEITTEVVRITQEIEKSFGPVSKGYSLTINFNSKNKILTQVCCNLRKITIHLPEYTMNSDKDSKLQRSLNLAHELVHTIIPNEKYDKVTVFEEGLAIYFSEEYINNRLSVPPALTARAEAGNLVRQLMKMNNAIVKNLRKRHPANNLSEFTEDDFIDMLGPEATNLAQSLAKPFYDAP
jgi:hypothetical protein